MALIRIDNGPLAGQVHLLGSDPITIGRFDEATIQLDDSGVSREHAEVFRVGELCFVKDLGSRNGTLLRDKLVTEEILQIGDRIQVGSTVLVFEYDEQTDPEASTESLHRLVLGICRGLRVEPEVGRAAELATLVHDSGRHLGDEDPVDAAVEAASLLSSVQGLETVAATVRARFERFDGTGRPRGLSGYEIPLTARILAVAQARQEGADLRSPGLDPEVVRALRTANPVMARSYLEEESDS